MPLKKHVRDYYPQLTPPVQLEPDYASSFEEYRKAPTPHTAGKLLSQLSPHIEQGLQLHVGGGNPLLRSHAKRIVLDSLPRYDAAKSKLGTFVVTQLQGLKRIARKQQQVISVPERVQLDKAVLRRSEQELLDELDREPTTQELADRTGFSMRRIKHLRLFQPGIPEGMLARRIEASDEEEGLTMPGLSPSDGRAWRELVYHDQDPINKQIMEHSFGMYGRRRLGTAEIARRLRLTPGAISQRKAQIQSMLDEALF